MRMRRHCLRILLDFTVFANYDIFTQMNIPPNTDSQDELIDKIANKVVTLVGSNLPVRQVRKSQLLSALVGAIGFALFVSGIEDMFAFFPDWALVSMGFILMILTGLLLQNLNR